MQVTGDARTLTSSPVSQRIALRVHVDEGLRYGLSGITFKHNRATGAAEILRSLFPISDGDVFSREKVAQGLENLRKAYGELGYLNFASVPDTRLDDDKKLISVEVDLDEGKQFYVSRVNILGLDEPAKRELLKDFPLKRGQIYSERLFELFLVEHASMFSACRCGYD